MADFQRVGVGNRDIDQEGSSLIWYYGKEEKQLDLRYVPGQRTMCKDKDEAEVWFVGLKALIARGSNQKVRNNGRADSVSSDSPQSRREENVATSGNFLSISVRFPRMPARTTSPASGKPSSPLSARSMLSPTIRASEKVIDDMKLINESLSQEVTYPRAQLKEMAERLADEHSASTRIGAANTEQVLNDANHYSNVSSVNNYQVYPKGGPNVSSSNSSLPNGTKAQNDKSESMV